MPFGRHGDLMKMWNGNKHGDLMKKRKNMGIWNLLTRLLERFAHYWRMFCSLFESFAHYSNVLLTIQKFCSLLDIFEKDRQARRPLFLSFNIVECAPARRVTNSDGEKQFPREFGLNIVLVVYFLK